jgi:hypothetical protein
VPRLDRRRADSRERRGDGRAADQAEPVSVAVPGVARRSELLKMLRPLFSIAPIFCDRINE